MATFSTDDFFSKSNSRRMRAALWTLIVCYVIFVRVLGWEWLLFFRPLLDPLTAAAIVLVVWQFFAARWNVGA